MDSKKTLIVFAHQDSSSFNGALKDVAVDTLRSQGHKVTVTDLYKMNFSCVVSNHQSQGTENQNLNKTEPFETSSSSILPEYLQREIDKLLEADLIILQCPILWLSLPAIMKGWIDQCMEVFFSANLQDMHEHSPIAGKKLMLSLTTGPGKGAYSNTGISGDMDVVLWPVQNSLHVAGLRILAPQISYAVRNVSQHERKEMLECWRVRLLKIFDEKPLPFIHPKNFDMDKGGQLSDAFMKNYCSDKAPTSGQNMGRGFKKGCLTGETQRR